MSKSYTTNETGAILSRFYNYKTTPVPEQNPSGGTGKTQKDAAVRVPPSPRVGGAPTTPGPSTVRVKPDSARRAAQNSLEMTGEELEEFKSYAFPARQAIFPWPVLGREHVADPVNEKWPKAYEPLTKPDNLGKLVGKLLRRYPGMTKGAALWLA